MKLITMIQAAALVVLAVVGAYAASDSPKMCPSKDAAEACEL